MKTHLATGQAGEKIANRYLKSNGYQILAKNWRFKRAEIDIIASKDAWIVFCEVKTRSNTFYGTPESFVDQKKKKLIVDAAIVYMESCSYSGEFRFDIISIVLKDEQQFGLKHFKDAFFPGLEGFM